MTFCTYDLGGSWAFLKGRSAMTMDSDVRARLYAPGPGNLQYTEREAAILCLIAEGLTNAQAARELLISRHTVAQHIALMLRTAGARSRAELVARAYSEGTLRTGVWPPAVRTAELRLADSALYVLRLTRARSKISRRRAGGGLRRRPGRLPRGPRPVAGPPS